jgi:hypothetical protein
VDKRLVFDLADFIRALQGRAVLEGEDVLSVPLAKGVSETDVYRDLRAALDRWEDQHPGIRTSILDGNGESRLDRQRSRLPPDRGAWGSPS